MLPEYNTPDLNRTYYTIYSSGIVARECEKKPITTLHPAQSRSYNLIYSPIIVTEECQSSHFSGEMEFHVFSGLIPSKSKEIPSQFGFETQCLY